MKTECQTKLIEANARYVAALWTSLRQPTGENVKARQEAARAYQAASE